MISVKPFIPFTKHSGTLKRKSNVFFTQWNLKLWIRLLGSFSSTRLLISNWSVIRIYKSKVNSSHFHFLTDGLKTVLDSASCSSSSSPSWLYSATLPFLQLPGHHYSRHGRLVPLCLTVHLDLGSTPVDKVGFAAQSTEGLTVNFLKLEFKCILITNVTTLILIFTLYIYIYCICIVLLHYIDINLPEA